LTELPATWIFLFVSWQTRLECSRVLTDRQASRLVAFLQDEDKDKPVFKGLKFDSTARSHVRLGRPTGRLQSGGGFRLPVDGLELGIDREIHCFFFHGPPCIVHGARVLCAGSLAALVYQHSLTPLSLPCKLILPEPPPQPAGSVRFYVGFDRLNV